MTIAVSKGVYAARIARVSDYIHDHLEDEIPLDVLAEIACLSRFHWHRIYTAMQGETVAATVRRLRLARAADRLANSQMPLAEIARRAGYSTAEAFGRAFKETYDLPPAAFRESGGHAKFKAATRARDAQGFPVSVEHVASQRCAAVSHRGSYMMIGRAMGSLFDALSSSQLRSGPPRMIGLFLDDPYSVPTDDLRSKACSPISDDVALPGALEDLTLRGGPYAKLRYRGPYADMKGAYGWLMGVWLPNSGQEAEDAPLFEEYLNSPADVAPTELLTDIYLPLKPDARS